MTATDACYARLLSVGFVVLTQAVESGDHEWVHAELELLHNIPSLLGEENVERHRYFWFQERTQYIDWVIRHGKDVTTSRMRTFYEPIWSEMEPLILEHIG